MFERAVAALPKEQASSLWDKMLQFEHTYGEGENILRLESRRRQEADTGIHYVFHQIAANRLLDLSLKNFFTNCYSFQGLETILRDELGAGGALSYLSFV